jgi:hypothetical protein
MATQSRQLKRHGALAGLGELAFAIALSAALPFAWHRMELSGARTVGWICVVVVALIDLSLIVRTVGTALKIRRGWDPGDSYSGVVWLASMILAAVSFASPASASTSSARSATASRLSSYVVRPGDSLYSIAETQLGDGAKWPLIVQANAEGSLAESLRNNPREIYSGWQLRLPSRESSDPSAFVSPLMNNDGPSELAAAPVHHFAASDNSFESSHSRGPLAPWPGGSFGALPLALIAKRRRDFLRQSRVELADDQIDATISQLRGYDDAQLRALARAIGERSEGLVAVSRLVSYDDELDLRHEPIVAVVLASDDEATLVAFARPGHALPVGLDALALVDQYAVVVNRHAQCRVTTSPESTLRALALRTNFDDVVVFLGPASQLDSEVAARCVTISAGPARHDNVLEWEGRTWHFATLAPAPPTHVVPRRHAVVAMVPRAATVRVELLRAEATVSGLEEPFLTTLRRRCIEMTAYLAVHHRDPVTGDLLRTRVLGDGSDASLRTLANTATAIRRSLGANDDGPRLRPVSSAGLYGVHDVSCDLVEFHQLVAAAREPAATNVATTLRRALTLVQGEPLANALRGFEWFLAEGYLARLQRDGEWAALALAHEAKATGDYDLAFWAIEQGRLLDPYSDALEAALHRIPRLREFGGNRSGTAKDEAVGAG